MYASEADGDNVRAPIGRGVAGAVAGRDAAPVEGHSHRNELGAAVILLDAGRQMETYARNTQIWEKHAKRIEQQQKINTSEAG